MYPQLSSPRGFAEAGRWDAAEFALSGSPRRGRVHLSAFRGVDEDDLAAINQEVARLAQRRAPTPPGSTGKVFSAYLLNGTAPIHFAWADPSRLAEQMRREVDYLYDADGVDGLERLGTGILKTSELQQKIFWLVRQKGEVAKRFPNAVRYESEIEAAEAARTVIRACEVAKRDVLNRAAATLPKTQEAAANLAVAELETAREDIRKEADRYLDIGGASRATGEEILTRDVPVGEVLLRGRDLAALTGALRTISERRRVLQAALDAHAQRLAIKQPPDVELARTALAMAGSIPPWRSASSRVHQTLCSTVLRLATADWKKSIDERSSAASTQPQVTASRLTLVRQP